MLADVSYDAAPGGRTEQRPESRQRVTYTCGHVIEGASLATADTEALDVEQRQSDETVDPA